MGKAKKWVLLSNPFDPTLIRNKLIFDLASNLSFEYSPKSYFLDVWFNDEYVGNYQLAEKIEFGKNRIPYDTSKPAKRRTSSTSTPRSIPSGLPWQNPSPLQKPNWSL